MTRGREYREGWEDGVRAAAQLAGLFDAQVDHPYRFEDVILCKFNLRPGRPRRSRAGGAAPDEEVARLRALLAERDAEIAEDEALHDVMRRRERPWVERWQRETGKALTSPDYGEILSWIMDKAERVEAELRAHHDEGAS